MNRLVVVFFFFFAFGSAKPQVTISNIDQRTDQPKQYTLNFVDSFFNTNYFLYSAIVRIIRPYEGKIKVASQLAIMNSVFVEKVNFNLMIFEKPVNLVSNHFENILAFQKTIFNDLSNLNVNTFQEIADFTDNTFNKPAVFEFSVFKNEARFLADSFKENVDFYRARFHNLVNFHGSIFYKNAKFDNIIIGDSAKLIFQEAVLPDSISFCNIPIIPDEIDLSRANFTDKSRCDSIHGKYKKGKWHYINLYKSNFAKFHLDYIHFRLFFIDPLTLNPLPPDEIKSMYEALLKNFKDRGQMDSYKLLDIEYQEYMDDSLWKWKTRLSRWWWNFGYEKGKIFGHTLLFLLIFTILNFFWLNRLNDKDGIYFIDRIPRVHPINSRITIKKLLSRIWYSLMYTGSIFFLFSLKIESIRFKSFGIVYIVLIHILGLICIAYMANFVLQR